MLRKRWNKWILLSLFIACSIWSYGRQDLVLFAFSTMGIAWWFLVVLWSRLLFWWQKPTLKVLAGAGEEEFVEALSPVVIGELPWFSWLSWFGEPKITLTSGEGFEQSVYLLDGKTSREMRVYFSRRGCLVAKEWKVTVQWADPWGLFVQRASWLGEESWWVRSQDLCLVETLGVDTSFSEDSKQLLILVEHPQGSELSEDLTEMRRYRWGDQPNRILWKLFARSGLLMSRVEERAEREYQRVWLHLLTGKEDEIAAQISLAMIKLLEEQGTPWLLTCDGLEGYENQWPGAVYYLCKSGHCWDRKTCSNHWGEVVSSLQPTQALWLGAARSEKWSEVVDFIKKSSGQLVHQMARTVSSPQALHSLRKVTSNLPVSEFWLSVKNRELFLKKAIDEDEMAPS